MGRIWKRFN